MYNEYPDLIYEGLLYDSLNSEILEEGFGESIKNGFAKLKTMAKTAFDKIIEKLKQFVANVSKFINKIKDKFKKVDDSNSSDANKNNSNTNSNNNANKNNSSNNSTKNNTSTNTNSNNSTKNNTNDDEEEEDDYPINYGDDDDNYRVYDDEVEIQEKDPYDEPLYNRNYRRKRTKRISSFKDNNRNVKVISKYNIDTDGLLEYVYDFKITFDRVYNAVRIINNNINYILNPEKDKSSNFRHDGYIDEDIEREEKSADRMFNNKTDEEFLSEFVLNYGSDKDYEEEMKKR